MLHTPAKLYTPHQPYIAPKPNLNFLLHTCIVPFERSEDTRSILFSFAHPLTTLYLKSNVSRNHVYQEPAVQSAGQHRNQVRGGRHLLQELLQREQGQHPHHRGAGVGQGDHQVTASQPATVLSNKTSNNSVTSQQLDCERLRASARQQRRHAAGADAGRDRAGAGRQVVHR